DQNSSSDNEPGSESDVGYKSRSSSGFSGSGSSSSKSNTGRKRRKQTAFFKELYRKPKTKSPEEKRQKIRDRLKKRGFTNLDYIEMKALAATNNEASQALKSAASFANQDNPAKAIEILEEQLDNLDPKDIKTRGKIQNALIMIYSNFGYPDKWQEMVHQMVATRRRILAVQKNTILANDPRSQDVFQEQEMLLNKDLAKALDGLPNFIEEMIKHKGLPPEMQNGAKAAFVTASNSSNGALSIKDINQSYKSIEARRSKHWANPK
ncbi:hypothetical protein MJH12_02970, partial [bacterium]|nr:hypothetical protein [bacterium]